MNQLQIMGRDVRSTPMQWAYEKKKLDAAVKCLSWRPPWVRPLAGQEQGSLESGFIEEAFRVDDDLGLGRIPFTWGTLNCRYNFAYDVQRMNVGAEYARAALVSKMDEQNHVRFAFTRDSPDIVAEMIGLRMELLMKVVMPTIVPHSKEQPFLCMARHEVSDGGHPHYHLFCVGSGNPGFKRVRRDVEERAAEVEADVDSNSDQDSDVASVGASLEEGSSGADEGEDGEEWCCRCSSSSS